MFRACFCPAKADTPLIIDANAVLTGTLPLERFKVVAWWYFQIFNSMRNLKLSQLAPRDIGNVHKPLDPLAS
jgi:hypothetical protein